MLHLHNHVGLVSNESEPENGVGLYFENLQQGNLSKLPTLIQTRGEKILQEDFQTTHGRVLMFS